MYLVTECQSHDHVESGCLCASAQLCALNIDILIIHLMLFAHALLTCDSTAVSTTVP